MGAVRHGAEDTFKCFKTEFRHYAHDAEQSMARPGDTNSHWPPLEALDAWRRKQPDLPSRAEAVRRLVAQRR
jgi:hypothetical protein